MVHEDFRAAGMGLAEAVVRTIDGTPADELQTLDVPGWPPDQAAIGPAGFGQAAGVQRSPMT